MPEFQVFSIALYAFAALPPWQIHGGTFTRFRIPDLGMDNYRSMCFAYPAGISAAARSVFFTIFLLILVEALDSLASLSTSLNGCVWSTRNDAKDSSGDPTSPSMDQVLYIFGIAFTQICSGRHAGRRVVSAAGSSSAGGRTIGRVG